MITLMLVWISAKYDKDDLLIALPLIAFLDLVLVITLGASGVFKSSGCL